MRARSNGETESVQRSSATAKSVVEGVRVGEQRPAPGDRGRSPGAQLSEALERFKLGQCFRAAICPNVRFDQVRAPRHVTRPAAEVAGHLPHALEAQNRLLGAPQPEVQPPERIKGMNLDLAVAGLARILDRIVRMAPTIRLLTEERLGRGQPKQCPDRRRIQVPLLGQLDGLTCRGPRAHQPAESKLEPGERPQRQNQVEQRSARPIVRLKT